MPAAGVKQTQRWTYHRASSGSGRALVKVFSLASLKDEMHAMSEGKHAVLTVPCMIYVEMRRPLLAFILPCSFSTGSTRNMAYTRLVHCPAVCLAGSNSGDRYVKQTMA